MSQDKISSSDEVNDQLVEDVMRHMANGDEDSYEAAKNFAEHFGKTIRKICASDE